MPPSTPTTQKVLDLAADIGILRPRDLERHRIPRTYLGRLVNGGELERIGRGLYRLPDADVTEYHSLVEVMARVPRGVVCLLSALRFHGLTTQNPFEVWLAIEQKAWRPKSDGVRIRLVHLSGSAFESGVEEHVVEGIPLRVYSAAKTVADCFKFRNKIGLDVALEALDDYRRTHRAGLDELWRCAKTVRVSEVMRPYLEAMS
jgi:predicted transcriptional regulator of viral defense system